MTGLAVHRHHLWDVDRVRRLIADPQDQATFFCGGSRNHGSFLDLFDEIFVLEVDLETLNQRLDQRHEGEWGGRGRPEERELILGLHRSGTDLPQRGVPIDAGAPLPQVVDEILRRSLGSADL